MFCLYGREAAVERNECAARALMTHFFFYGSGCRKERVRSKGATDTFFDGNVSGKERVHSKGANDTLICMGTAVERKECAARALMRHLFLFMGTAVKSKECTARALMTHLCLLWERRYLPSGRTKL